jgi:predicted MFS family arabinose efflux permease
MADAHPGCSGTVSGLLVSLACGPQIGLLAGASLGWRVVFSGLGALSLLLGWANSRAWRDVRAAKNRIATPNRLTAALVAARLAPTSAWSTAVYAVYTVAQLFFPAQQVRLADELPANRATVLAWNNTACFWGSDSAP